MNAHTVSFVRLIDLFGGYYGLLSDFVSNKLTSLHSYGESQHYLVSQDEILDHLESFADDYPEWEQETEAVKKRIERLRPDVFIDLSVKS